MKNLTSVSVEYLDGAYHIMSRERASSGFPRNIHSLSKETYKTFEEANVAMLNK